MVYSSLFFWATYSWKAWFSRATETQHRGSSKAQEKEKNSLRVHTLACALPFAFVSQMNKTGFRLRCKFLF